jgi:signal transduction histidine kinase
MRVRVKRIFGTLRGRIFAALFAISLVPIAVLGAQGYHCAMQAVTELAHKHLQAVSDARASAVGSWFTESTKDIETLSALLSSTGAPEGADFLTSAQHQERVLRALTSFQALNPSFADIGVYDLEWNRVLPATSARHGDGCMIDLELRSAVKSAGQSVVGVAHGHADGDVGIHVACPVKRFDGHVIAYLAGNLDFAATLYPVLQDRKGLYKTGKAYLVSQRGEILTEPLGSEKIALTGTRVEMPFHSGMVMSSHGTKGYVDYRGRPVLRAASPVGFEDWQLVAEIDKKEALAWLAVLLDRAVATGLVTCVVVVFIAVWITRLVGKPLKHLVRIAHRIRSGHVEERLARMDVSEAEEVRQAFNAMLDELHEKQKQLVRTETLAYVGELTSSTVHEMRNPLSSVKMNLQALCRAVRGNARHEELGEIAIQQTTRLENMLTDLLTFGRPVDLCRETVPFEDLVRATLDVVGDTAADKGVEIDVEDLLGGAMLQVDKEQMCRALTNLVGNAVEAMPSGGRVEIMGKPVRGKKPKIEIVVQDSGGGFPEEALNRAFQPFYTSKTEGTGLGLPNVKKIVELHGGKITLENSDEIGAIARIVLPIINAELG